MALTNATASKAYKALLIVRILCLPNQYPTSKIKYSQPLELQFAHESECPWLIASSSCQHLPNSVVCWVLLSCTLRLEFGNQEQEAQEKMNQQQAIKQTYKPEKQSDTTGGTLAMRLDQKLRPDPRLYPESMKQQTRQVCPAAMR